MKQSIALFILAFSVVLLSAQENPRAEISFYADVMVHASVPEHRIRASQELHHRLSEYLQSPASHTDAFADLPWITIVIPTDSLFRIITWQVEEAEDFRYGGFIQPLKKEGTSLTELKDSRALKSEYALHDPGSWYGALYYGIQPFKTADEKDAYLVLGFNAHTKQLNQRVADVIVWNGNSIMFGMPVFRDSADVRSRIILEYTDAASATMRFDREKDLLIYDHVITIETPEGPALVPDGSYHGFQYKKGLWDFIDTVFTVTVDQPPGGKPKDAVKRDLFGREMDRKN